MDLLGKEYIIDHALQEYKNQSEREAYSFFVSELLRSINNSIVNAIGGTKYEKSFEQLKNYKPETRTGEEVQDHVLGKVQELKERWAQYGSDGDIC